MCPLPSLTPPQRVYSAFALYAMAIGGIFPRLGDLQRTLGLDERTLGLALIGTATGTLLSLTFASRWLLRLGHGRALRWLIPAIAAVYAAASWAPGAWALYALLVPAGLCIGAVEVVVNLEADRRGAGPVRRRRASPPGGHDGADHNGLNDRRATRHPAWVKIRRWKPPAT